MTSPTTYALIEHWDGTSWTYVQEPKVRGIMQWLNAVSGTSGRDVWAVGSSYQGDGQVTLVEHWDGSTWSRVPSPTRPRARNSG
ncbi:MAG: hypothetical protein M3O94_04900 [Actinomycetota bacterium]|nr:hypothetical protein [Actinomycetota bacterium]